MAAETDDAKLTKLIDGTVTKPESSRAAVVTESREENNVSYQEAVNFEDEKQIVSQEVIKVDEIAQKSQTDDEKVEEANGDLCTDERPESDQATADQVDDTNTDTDQATVIEVLNTQQVPESETLTNLNEIANEIVESPVSDVISSTTEVIESDVNEVTAELTVLKIEDSESEAESVPELSIKEEAVSEQVSDIVQSVIEPEAEVTIDTADVVVTTDVLDNLVEKQVEQLPVTELSQLPVVATTISDDDIVIVELVKEEAKPEETVEEQVEDFTMSVIKTAQETVAAEAPVIEEVLITAEPVLVAETSVVEQVTEPAVEEVVVTEPIVAVTAEPIVDSVVAEIPVLEEVEVVEAVTTAEPIVPPEVADKISETVKNIMELMAEPEKAEITVIEPIVDTVVIETPVVEQVVEPAVESTVEAVTVAEPIVDAEEPVLEKLVLQSIVPMEVAEEVSETAVDVPAIEEVIPEPTVETVTVAEPIVESVVLETPVLEQIVEPAVETVTVEEPIIAVEVADEVSQTAADVLAITEIIPEPTVEAVAVAEPVVAVDSAAEVSEIVPVITEILLEPAVEAIAVAEPIVDAVTVDTPVVEQVVAPAIEAVTIAEPIVVLEVVEDVAETTADVPVITEIIPEPTVDALTVVEPLVDAVATEAPVLEQIVEPVAEAVTEPIVAVKAVEEVMETVEDVPAITDIIAEPTVEAVTVAEPIVEAVTVVEPIVVAETPVLEQVVDTAVEAVTEPIVQVEVAEEVAVIEETVLDPVLHIPTDSIEDLTKLPELITNNEPEDVLAVAEPISEPEPITLVVPDLTAESQETQILTDIPIEAAKPEPPVVSELTEAPIVTEEVIAISPTILPIVDLPVETIEVLDKVEAEVAPVEVAELAPVELVLPTAVDSVSEVVDNVMESSTEEESVVKIEEIASKVETETTNLTMVATETASAVVAPEPTEPTTEIPVQAINIPTEPAVIAKSLPRPQTPSEVDDESSNTFAPHNDPSRLTVTEKVTLHERSIQLSSPYSTGGSFTSPNALTQSLTDKFEPIQMNELTTEDKDIFTPESNATDAPAMPDDEVAIEPVSLSLSVSETDSDKEEPSTEKEQSEVPLEVEMEEVVQVALVSVLDESELAAEPPVIVSSETDTMISDSVTENVADISVAPIPPPTKNSEDTDELIAQFSLNDTDTESRFTESDMPIPAPDDETVEVMSKAPIATLVQSEDSLLVEDIPVAEETSVVEDISVVEDTQVPVVVPIVVPEKAVSDSDSNTLDVIDEESCQIMINEPAALVASVPTEDITAESDVPDPEPVTEVTTEVIITEVTTEEKPLDAVSVEVEETDFTQSILSEVDQRISESEHSTEVPHDKAIADIAVVDLVPDVVIVPEKPLREAPSEEPLDVEPPLELTPEVANGLTQIAESVETTEKAQVEIVDSDETSPRAIKKKKNKFCRCC